MALTVVKVGSLPGLICSLDDAGVLSICYQGTDPPTSAVMGSDSKEVDYDHINQEHRKLLQVAFGYRGEKMIALRRHCIAVVAGRFLPTKHTLEWGSL